MEDRLLHYCRTGEQNVDQIWVFLADLSRLYEYECVKLGFMIPDYYLNN